MKTSLYKCKFASGETSKQQSQPVRGHLLVETQASAIPKSSTHNCTSFPPISPCAVMNRTVILTNRYSKNPDKKIQAERYMKRLQEIIKKYDSDEHASKYLTDVFSLMMKQSAEIYDFRQNTDRKLDREDEIWRLKETSLTDIKKSEMDRFEDIYTIAFKNLAERRAAKLKSLDELSSPVTLKGSISRLLSVGGLASLLVAAQKEIIALVKSIAPSFPNLVYLWALASVGLAVAITSRVIGNYVAKKRCETVENFNKEEENLVKRYNDEKQLLIKRQEERDENAYKIYVGRKAEIEKEDQIYRQARAAFVYLEAFKLCDSFYPEYTKKYIKYTELKEKEPDRALDYIREHAEQLSKATLIAESVKGSLTDMK